MNLDLNEAERQLLSELLDAAYREQLHGLHHTDTDAYRQILRHHVDTLEALRAKLGAAAAPPLSD